MPYKSPEDHRRRNRDWRQANPDKVAQHNRLRYLRRWDKRTDCDFRGLLQRSQPTRRLAHYFGEPRL